MRLHRLLPAVGLVAVLVPAAAHAAPVPEDALCPRAVPKLVAFNDATGSKDVAKIGGAARDAAAAYQLCASDAQVTKGVAVEPTVNYDKTRAAQFLVVYGRTQTAGGNTAEAITAFKDAKRLASDVATWQPESQTWHASQTTGAPGGMHDDSPGPSGGNSAGRNTDRNGSRYKTAAAEIVTAADQELAKLEPAKTK
ncbi:MAG TPA: hypothetical protein VHT53_01075 [Candidatus Elarobacter sp.]|nr:hypothetical protein [Candidatus Elarobacter sp.]